MINPVVCTVIKVLDLEHGGSLWMRVASVEPGSVSWGETKIGEVLQTSCQIISISQGLVDHSR